MSEGSEVLTCRYNDQITMEVALQISTKKNQELEEIKVKMKIEEELQEYVKKKKTKQASLGKLYQEMLPVFLRQAKYYCSTTKLTRIPYLPVFFHWAYSFLFVSLTL